MDNFPPAGAGFGPGPSSMPAPAPAKGKGKTRKSRRSAPANGEPKVTRRVITRTRLITIVFALVAALLVALVLQQEPESTYVVRAKASIGAGAIVSADQFEPVKVDPAAVEEGAYSGTDADAIYKEAVSDLADGRLLYPMAKGQQVRADLFTTETSLETFLNPDERLMSISAVAATSVAGTLRPGDKVDIVGVNTSQNETVAALIKADVPLESVSLSGEQLDSLSAAQSNPDDANYDKTVGEIVPALPVPGTYVVRVLESDVLRLAVADGDGTTTLYLVYRGADAVTTEQLPVYVSEALGLNTAAPVQ